MFSRRTLVACTWLAAILVVAGVAGVLRTRAGLSRSLTVVDGTPVELVCPAGRTSPAPAAIVVHGFSGSRQLMYGIGQTLARNGICAAMIDLPGHGANRSHMGAAQAPGRGAGFDAAVASTIRFLRAQPGVAADRIALVGHSMGAGVVMRFGAQHPDIAATVAISGAGGRTESRSGGPANLLLVVGGWEFARVIDGSLGALQAGYPGAVAGVTYGRPEDGTARRLLVAPRVEHIGVLFSRTVIGEVVSWIAAATGVPLQHSPAFAVPMWWVWLIYAGIAIGFIPLAGALFGSAADAEPLPGAETAWTWRARLAVVILVPVAAAAAARVFPTRWVPLMTADYLTSFFFSAGIILCAVLVAAHRRLLVGAPTPAHFGRAVVLTLYVLGGFAVTAQYTWMHLQLTGERQWVALAVFPVWLVYFLADEALLGDLAGGRRAAWCVTGKLVTVAVLLGSVFLGGAPFFLLLLAPALVPMFLLHAFYSHELHRVGAGSVPAAILNATVFAWTMAAVFPLV